MTETKTASIFDHLSGITDKKIPWSKLSDADKKSFSPFMINKWLSMNMDFIETVNELQVYTIGNLSAAEVYKLYFDILPKSKQYNKYIKGSKSNKFNPDLIQLFASHFQVSEKEALAHIDFYMEIDKTYIEDIVRKYGKTDAEVKKLLKTEK
jgi:hypothetical protein